MVLQHALPGSGIEAVCGSRQGLEKILPVTSVLVLAAAGLPHRNRGFLTG